MPDEPEQKRTGALAGAAMTTLTMGELFAGIGGFSVGFHRAGFETRWAVEWDRDCQRVLAERFPGVPIHGDITTVDPAALAPVDVITFGFPCQDLSVAGKRAGLEGGRSGLFWEAMRVINALRPTVIVAENVPGLLSSNGGRDMASVLWGFLDAGYSDVGWAILDAQWWGVAQRRRRVFIVGCPGNRRASEILAFADGLSGHPAPRRETGQGVTSLLEIGARTSGDGYRDGDGISDPDDPMFTLQATKQHGVCFGITDDETAAENLLPTMGLPSATGGGRPPATAYTIFQHNQRDEVRDLGDVAGALPAQPGMKQQNYIAVRTANTSVNGHGVADDVAHTIDGANGQAIAFTCKDHGADAGSVSPTLRAMPHDQTWANGGGQVAVAHATNTLRANAGMPKHAADETRLVASQMAVRRLTPRECERLQGFPEIEKNVTIRVWLNCTDHPKNCVLAEVQSRKSQRLVETVESDKSQATAWSAEHSSRPKPQSDSRPVAVSVRIDSERNAVEIHNHGKCLWSANGAVKPSSSPLSMPTDDFARLVVHTISTAEQTIGLGRVESLQGIGRSTLRKSGESAVDVCGRETDVLAGDVAASTTARNDHSTSTTSGATSSSLNSDSTLTTLCCSVLSAMRSCIPAPTSNENSYDISITVVSGWTAVDGMADSPRYRMLGNAVAVPVVEWIGRRIAEALA